MALVNIEIDGKPTSVDSSQTVMEAARSLGIKIPHFCYHRKLSIAANCRMCLVEVEKVPKPLPACATFATEGMKVKTHSPFAVKAQTSVMEFLLRNHPLDCPICDQGGECKLQDVSVGYGVPHSRYNEPKRVVSNKELGPLIHTDMTRCILCTRCVRFGQEIGGIMELGAIGRGDHTEIMSFMDQSVDSEVSGNVIDVCPVGALTNKPFRYKARTWELSRHAGISPHDGLGSNLEIQVKMNQQVVRVVPADNEAVNECWLSDRDRFSYEGVNSSDRLLRPLVKQEDGSWEEASWSDALQIVVDAIEKIKDVHGAQALGALVSPNQTLEELYLLQKLMRDLGSHNIDHRTLQSDFALDAELAKSTWLGMPVEALNSLKSVLVVGSSLRSEHPLIAVRLRRQAAKGAAINLVNSFRDDLAMPVANQLVGAPAQMPALLAQVLAAAHESKGQSVPADVSALAGSVSDTARQIAKSLENAPAGILLGNMAQHHGQWSTLYKLASRLSQVMNVPFGVLGESANSVGAQLAGAIPHRGAQGVPVQSGLNASAMLQNPRKAYLVMGLEQEDFANPAAAMAALKSADFVVAFSAFRGEIPQWAHVILPLATLGETAGSTVNMEGRLQSFKGALPPAGEARPGWKVLRVLGNLLDLPGYDYESSEDVRNQLVHEGEAALKTLLGNEVNASNLGTVLSVSGVQRIAPRSSYHTDALVRRADSLQNTRIGREAVVQMPPTLASSLGVACGDRIRVRSGYGVAELTLKVVAGIAEGCVSIPAGHPLTTGLPLAATTVSLERL